jgi:hypothetical protein
MPVIKVGIDSFDFKIVSNRTEKLTYEMLMYTQEGNSELHISSTGA